MKVLRLALASYPMIVLFFLQAYSLYILALKGIHVLSLHKWFSRVLTLTPLLLLCRNLSFALVLCHFTELCMMRKIFTRLNTIRITASVFVLRTTVAWLYLFVGSKWPHVNNLQTHKSAVSKPDIASGKTIAAVVKVVITAIEWLLFFCFSN